MTETPEAGATPAGLNCFEGQPPPAVVAEGWKQLAAIPKKSWESFWLLLAPVVMNPGSTANKDLVTLFCKEHDIAPESLLVAMGCCELLLKQAAALNLSKEIFRRDLAVLAGDDSDELVHFVVQRFAGAMKGIRRQIFMESLSTHGKVMTGLDWRIDKVKHSSKGNHFDTDIVFLTVHFRRAGARARSPCN
ncbi:MAG: hypothetical protein P8X55_12155 [Desulfosarcinaceae bacterium]